MKYSLLPHIRPIEFTKNLQIMQLRGSVEYLRDFIGFFSFLFKIKLDLANSADPDEMPHIVAIHLGFTLFHPYKPVVLFVGHMQTVENQIRCRRMWRLIRVSTVCLRIGLSKFE